MDPTLPSVWWRLVESSLVNLGLAQWYHMRYHIEPSLDRSPSMGNYDRLLGKAVRNPAGLRFAELGGPDE